MKYLFLFLFIIIDCALAAQNLVPNPGFDDLTDCPFDEAQIHFAAPWVTASNGTPDLFDECATNQFYQIKVPNAGRWLDSYQLQRSRSGYAGLYVYANANGTPGNSEYMETPLIASLIQGTQYYAEFYVSPDYTQIYNFGFTDAVGLALSDTFYYKELNAMEALPLNPVIENKGTTIKDTSGWTRISGCHTAKGGEKFAIIGNFRNTQETLVEFVNPTYPFISYIYIEDVLIQAFDPLPDTLLLCDGQLKILNAGFLDAAYRWSTGSTDSTITVQSPGIYSVEAMMDQCILRDTVTVLDLSETKTFPKDTIICSGEPLVLTAPLIGDYSWSDGTKNKTNIVQASGNFEVTVTNECGQFVFSTDVDVKECACNIYVPNAISPNNDGLNDDLQVFIGCDYPYRIKRFSIFDRWGGNMYSATEGMDIRWNGKYKGNDLPNGVYAWLLEYEFIRNGAVQRFTKSGNVSILK